MKPLYTIKYRFNRREAFNISLAVSKVISKHGLFLLLFYIVSAFITFRSLYLFFKVKFEFSVYIFILFFAAMFIALTVIILKILKGTLLNSNIPSIDTHIDLYEDYYVFENYPFKRYKYVDERGEPYKLLNRIYYVNDDNSICRLSVDTKLYSKEICEFIDSKLNKRNHL